MERTSNINNYNNNEGQDGLRRHFAWCQLFGTGSCMSLCNCKSIGWFDEDAYVSISVQQTLSFTALSLATMMLSMCQSRK
jgi:hypothetical protein